MTIWFKTMAKLRKKNVSSTTHRCIKWSSMKPRNQISNTYAIGKENSVLKYNTLARTGGFAGCTWKIIISCCQTDIWYETKPKLCYMSPSEQVLHIHLSVWIYLKGTMTERFHHVSGKQLHARPDLFPSCHTTLIFAPCKNFENLRQTPS